MHCDALMPTATRSGLATLEFPAKSGIKIQEVINTSGGRVFGGSFEVLIPAKVRGRGKGGRIRKRFKKKEDAKRFAKQQYEGLGARGSAFFSLNTQLQDEVAAFVPELEKSGQSLDELKKFLKNLESEDAKLSDIAKGLSRLRAAGLDFDRSVRFCETHLMPTGADITFSKVVEEMINLKKERVVNGSLRPVSLDTFTQQTRRMTKAFGELKIERVSRAVIMDWIKGLGVSGRSNQNYLDACIEVLNYAIDENYIKFSPLSGFKGQKRKALIGSGEKGKNITILSIDEVGRLLGAARELNEIGFLGYLIITLFCGVRAEEAKGLQWKEVHDTQKEPFLTIGPQMAKGRRIRHVDIPPNAVNWLSLISDRSGKVVEFRDKNHFDRMFRKLRGRAGFRKKNDKGNWVSTWNNNAIRHSFGTYHFALYGDPIKTAVQMGHKSDDQVLFDHYRALATKAEGQAFFSITPPANQTKTIKTE